eukprot:873588-Rhodomonas_salina.1
MNRRASISCYESVGTNQWLCCTELGFQTLRGTLWIADRKVLRGIPARSYEDSAREPLTCVGGVPSFC